MRATEADDTVLCRFTFAWPAAIAGGLVGGGTQIIDTEGQLDVETGTFVGIRTGGTTRTVSAN